MGKKGAKQAQKALCLTSSCQSSFLMPSFAPFAIFAIFAPFVTFAVKCL